MGCTVLTYPIKEGESTLDLPIGSRILGIRSHSRDSLGDTDALLYVLAPDSMASEKRRILLSSTGEWISHGMNELAYLGTAKCHVVRGRTEESYGFQVEVAYHLFEVAPE